MQLLDRKVLILLGSLSTSDIHCVQECCIVDTQSLSPFQHYTYTFAVNNSTEQHMSQNTLLDCLLIQAPIRRPCTMTSMHWHAYRHTDMSTDYQQVKGT